MQKDNLWIHCDWDGKRQIRTLLVAAPKMANCNKHWEIMNLKDLIWIYLLKYTDNHKALHTFNTKIMYYKVKEDVKLRLMSVLNDKGKKKLTEK